MDLDNTSLHFNLERKDRELFINQHIGLGNVLDSFTVCRGHIRGDEIHSITDTGVIIIQNAINKKIITEIVARPGQIKRLYRSVGKKPPKKLMQLAHKHNMMHYNEI